MGLIWQRTCLEYAEFLVSNPELHEPDIVAKACNSSTWKVEAGESEIPAHPWLYNNSEAELGYVRICLTKKQIDEWMDG